MTAVFALFAHLLEQVLLPLPSLAFMILPAMIAIAGAASLNARSDDRIRAWVQIISALALTAWMAAPWHPTDPALIGMNRSMTLFTYGYVLQDWLRETWRSGLSPRWAHLCVIATLIACVAAVVFA